MIDNITKYWPYLATIVAILTFLMGYLFNSQIKEILDLVYSNFSTNPRMLKSKQKEIFRTLIIYTISIVFVSCAITIITSPITIWILKNSRLSLNNVDYSVTFYSIAYFLILLLFLFSLLIEYRLIKKYIKFRV